MKTISGKHYAALYIETLSSFKTRSGNFRGEAVPVGDRTDYYIYSYQTMIAEYWEGVWYINDTRYSSETSKHQSIIRRALGEWYWVNNTVHVDDLYRGVATLWAFAAGNTAERRADRVRDSKWDSLLDSPIRRNVFSDMSTSAKTITV